MTLHVHEAGDPAGPPVLAVHGVTGHGRRFDPLARRLPGLRWISVDVRGHGRSTWAPPWNLEQHVADLIAVLDGLGVGRAAVVGHSFGGAIAVHLARTATARVERLVLLDPAHGLDPHDMLDTAEDSRTAGAWPTREAARAAKAQDWAGVPDALVDAEVAAHLDHRDGAWRWRYSAASLVAAWAEMARPALVPPRGLPTMVLPATGADFVDDDWLAACRAELGDALAVVGVDAGHMLYLEQPDVVAGHLAGFLGVTATPPA